MRFVQDLEPEKIKDFWISKLFTTNSVLHHVIYPSNIEIIYLVCLINSSGMISLIDLTLLTGKLLSMFSSCLMMSGHHILIVLENNAT